MREGRDRLVTIHGNRLILHMVFRQLGQKALLSAEPEFEVARTTVQSVATKLLNDTIQGVSSNYANSYPANLFKTVTKCKELTEAVLAANT
jgi:hypothetical protein